MATSPTPATPATPAKPATPATPQAPATGFQPAYKRVAQTNDFDCAFACIATICSKTLAEVRQLASERFKIPKHGPYVWMDRELVANLLAHWSYAATDWEETTGIATLPDVAIGLVEYNPDTEIGRHVVFVRQRGAAGKPNVEYIIDPAYWIDPSKHVRTDIKGFPISWHIGVTPMKREGK